MLKKEVKIYPEIIDNTEYSHIKIDDIYTCTIACIEYPKILTDEFTKNLININIEYEIMFMYERQDVYKILKEVNYYISRAKIDRNSKNIDSDIIFESEEDAKYIKKEISTNNQEIYNCIILIKIKSNSKESLQLKLETIQNFLYSKGIYSRKLIFNQLKSYIFSLPFYDSRDKMFQQLSNILMSDNVGVKYPFITENIFEPGGVLFGVDRANKSLVQLNLFKNKNNANALVIGMSGAGKSHFIKLIMIRNRYYDVKQFVIDPDGEYKKIFYKDIEKNSQNNINIFDIQLNNLKHSTQDIDNKVVEILCFIKINTNIVKEEEQILRECIYELYVNKRDINNNIRFVDLYNKLKNNKRSIGLIDKIGSYVYGEYKKYNNITNIKNMEGVYVFDISNIDRKFISAEIFLIINYIWNKVKKDKGKKIIYFDEVWKLFCYDIAICVKEQIANIFKTIRKYGGGAIAISQDVDDFLEGDNLNFSKTILTNTSTKIIFQIRDDKLYDLKRTLNLKEDSIEKISKLRRGECLLNIENTSVILEVKANNTENEMVKNIMEENY